VRSFAALLLLLLCALSCFGEAAEDPSEYPLLYFGQVLLADPAKLELRRVGELSPAAPSVAADQEGRLWGRLEPRYLAAIDPASGRLCARVELPRKPYNHLITSAGKAYVTHSALTKEGFTLSVVDTRRSVLLRELTGIAGLRTDLAQAAGFVYLAAAGVGKEDSRHCYLYQIDGATDRIREALHSPDTGFYWKLAAAGERLYLGWLPARDAASSVGSAAFGRVEVRDARSLEVLRTWGEAPGPLRALFAAAGQVLLFFADQEGNTDLLVLDPLLGAVLQARQLAGPVARVLGLRAGILTYLDRRFETGHTEVNVCFYELEAGRELKRIAIGGKR
jgi:hypothetical protein